MILTSGTKLGPYEILSPLGAGGMGEVWKAKDTRLDRMVAIKVLPEHLTTNAEALARFEREAKAVAALNHPYLVAIHDFVTHETTPYVVMELLEGESLRDRLHQGPLPARKAIELAVQMAEGLAAAHEKGVIHRDLKPDNLWITKNGRLKILDFGLAKRVVLPKHGSQSFLPTQAISVDPAQPTQEGMILGTMSYMSPEQARGETVDARSDLFSFGAVLFEMLTGRKAFAKNTASDTLAAILRDDLPEPENASNPIPVGLQRILHHCLEKDPAHRFQDAHDLAFALGNLGSSTSEQRPMEVGIGNPARPQRALSRLLALVSAAATVCALALWIRGTKSVQGPSSFRQLNLRTEDIFRAAFAPDGKTIVYSAAQTGNRPELFVVRPENPEPQPMGHRDTHLLSISSKGELAVLIRARYIHHRLFAGTLARVPIGGAAPREILDNVRDADWSPDAARLAIIRDVNGKDRLEYPIGTVLCESAGYLSDLRISPHGDRVAYFEHPVRWDDRGAVNVVNLKGQVKRLADGFAALEGLAWSPDGKEILFSAASSGSSLQLYAVDLAGRKRFAFESPGGITLHDIHASGQWLTTRDDNLSAVMAHIDGVEKDRDLSWLDGSMQPRLSADGRTIVFSEFGSFVGANYAACMRGTDESPVVRLGEGSVEDLSRDGKWVLSHVSTTPPRLMVYPIGPGESRQLNLGSLEPRGHATWFRDGARVLASASERGRGSRCYVLDLHGGPPRPVTPEGVDRGHLSPDERWVLAKGAGGVYGLYPLEGGTPREANGLEPADDVIRWSADGLSVLTRRGNEIPCRVERVNLDTGRRELYRAIAPSNLSGLIAITPTFISDDERSYAYQIQRHTSKLFVSEGPR